MTTFVERSIEVEVPVRTAYDQWTQFEEFPRFMSGVREVRQVGDALTHWVADIAGVKREWDAAILEQVPDEKVAWAATGGATNAGAVYFTAVGDDRTRVRLTLEFEPEGIVERIGDVFDIVDRQAVADLDRFKEYIEREGSATGGWRGTVEEGEVQDDADVRGSSAAAGGGGDPADDVPGDLVAVGPTGGTRGTVSTEPGSAGGETAGRADDAGVGHGGDPAAVDRAEAADDEWGGDPVAVEPPPGAGWGDEPGTRGGATATDPAAEDWDAPRTGSPGRGTAETGRGDVDGDRVDVDTTGVVPSRTEPVTLDSVDAPGAADGVGGGLDPLDPRVGTADDPDNPRRPSA